MERWKRQDDLIQYINRFNTGFLPSMFSVSLDAARGSVFFVCTCTGLEKKKKTGGLLNFNTCTVIERSSHSAKCVEVGHELWPGKTGWFDVWQ